jgi:hypothetical protein
MSPDRMSATSVAHKSTGGTLQSLPEPVDPVGDAPDYLTFKTVAPLRQPVCTSCLHFGEREKIRAKCGILSARSVTERAGSRRIQPIRRVFSLCKTETVRFSA